MGLKKCRTWKTNLVCMFNTKNRVSYLMAICYVLLGYSYISSWYFTFTTVCYTVGILLIVAKRTVKLLTNANLTNCSKVRSGNAPSPVLHKFIFLQCQQTYPIHPCRLVSEHLPCPFSSEVQPFSTVKRAKMKLSENMSQMNGVSHIFHYLVLMHWKKLY